jgi:hypothetical protein
VIDIDENILDKAIKTIDKAIINNQIKYSFVVMVAPRHYQIMLYVIGQKDYIQKKNVKYMI